MSSPGAVLAARIVTSCRAAGVATQAGIPALDWASTDTPHVFRGIGGYLNGRSRGRLPFIEIEIATQGFESESPDGGTLTSTVTVRAHCGGSDAGAAADRLEAILLAALASIRSEASDNYMAIGSDSVGPIVPGPWGHTRDATVTVQHSFNRSNYEVT